MHEKGGKFHRLVCHHNLEKYLDEYIAGAELEKTPTAPLFQSVTSRTGKKLSGAPMKQPDVYVMISRRAEAAGIKTKIGCHSFRATGITEYLKNGGKLEVAQQMANDESASTTGLYDRRNDQVSLDEVERIVTCHGGDPRFSSRRFATSAGLDRRLLEGAGSVRAPPRTSAACEHSAT